MAESSQANSAVFYLVILGGADRTKMLLAVQIYLRRIKMFKIIKNCKKGFTLLELLVVVLIIGILAAIALPQYNKAVEKAKVTEALLNIKAIEESMQRYILANGYPQSTVHFGDFADIELSGGEWDEDVIYYTTKDFEYNPSIGRGYYSMEVYRNNGKYAFLTDSREDPAYHLCVTELSDIGRYICKYLESQGWEYVDQDY